MSRHVEIRFVNPSLALVNGHGTREMLTELIGRPPVWATVSRGWVVQPHRARDLVAILEHRGGYDVTVTNVSDEKLFTAVNSRTGQRVGQSEASQ